MREALGGHQMQAVEQLLERRLELGAAQAGGLQLRCGLVVVADVFEVVDVAVVADGVGHRHAGLPEPGHDLVLVTHPAVLEEVLAVGRHPFDGSPVARLPELAALPVLHVVDERGGPLHAECFELALVLHLPRQVALAGEDAGAAVVAVALDEVDLGFLARLDDAEVVFVVVLGDEPRRCGTHDARTPVCEVDEGIGRAARRCRQRSASAAEGGNRACSHGFDLLSAR